MRLTNSLILFFLLLLLGHPLQASQSDRPQTSQGWLSFLRGNQSVHVPIVFVHGIGAGFEKWDKVANHISAGQVSTMRFKDDHTLDYTYQGKAPSVWVWNVSYYSPQIVEESLSGNLTLYAERLEKILQEITRITSANQFVLVAHSMGGLVARKYATLHPSNDQHIAALLTVGTPHEGVPFSFPWVGQLQDLRHGSNFLHDLDQEWELLIKRHKPKWGVIGGVQFVSTADIREDMTDAGGPGYVQIRSSIPFGEWKKASSQLGIPLLNTPHFGFCCAVKADHNEMLEVPAVYDGIFWAANRELGVDHVTTAPAD